MSRDEWEDERRSFRLLGPKEFGYLDISQAISHILRLAPQRNLSLRRRKFRFLINISLYLLKTQESGVATVAKWVVCGSSGHSYSGSLICSLSSGDGVNKCSFQAFRALVRVRLLAQRLVEHSAHSQYHCSRAQGWLLIVFALLLLLLLPTVDNGNRKGKNTAKKTKWNQQMASGWSQRRSRWARLLPRERRDITVCLAPRCENVDLCWTQIFKSIGNELIHCQRVLMLSRSMTLADIISTFNMPHSR